MKPGGQHEAAPMTVLLLEDSPRDVRLTPEAFRDANRAVRLHVTSDGVEAMAFLRREEALEALVEDINDFWLTTAKLPHRTPAER